MIEVNKLFLFFFLAVFIETLVKVWENSKKLWKHSPAARVPTAFLVIPNFHSCFYNSFKRELSTQSVKYMYQPKKSSSSSPRNLFLQLSGNSFWICSHRLESTNVPFREFLLAQLDILIRQRGQRKFASSTFFLKHGPHSSCSHGIITGSMSICKHIGHVKSDKETEMSVPSLKFTVLGLATFPAAILRINNNLYFWRQIITFGPVPQSIVLLH